MITHSFDSHAELAAMEVADVLNVSIAYAYKRMEEGTIPSRFVGITRRALYEDVMAYKKAHFEARSKILTEMAAMDQELGLMDNELRMIGLL